MRAEFCMDRLTESELVEVLRQSQWCRDKSNELSDWLRHVVAVERTRRRGKAAPDGEFRDWPCESWNNRTVSMVLACATSISYAPSGPELCEFFDRLAKSAVALAMSRLEQISILGTPGG